MGSKNLKAVSVIGTTDKQAQIGSAQPQAGRFIFPFDVAFKKKVCVIGTVVKEGVAKVPPKAMFYVSTVEYVELPDDVAAQLWTRTSWIRKGLIVGLGKIDAGFHGTLTFMGSNLSAKEVEIPIGCRFVQMCFETQPQLRVGRFLQILSKFGEELGALRQVLSKHSRTATCASQRFNEAYGATDFSYRLLLRNPARAQDLIKELQEVNGVGRVSSLQAGDESEL